jgi:hypothetical protein
MTEAARDPLDHPLYRIGHLHGDRWVTLRPTDQHAPREHDPDGAWADGVVYVCPTCDEQVVIAANTDGAA